MRLKNSSTTKLFYLGLFIALGLSYGSEAVRVLAPQSASAADAPLFARVGDREITRQELEVAILRAKRQRFYHFQPPAEQLERFRQEIAQTVIDRALLLEEAARREIRPDAEKLAQELERYEKRYAKSPRWQSEGEAMKATLRGYLEDQDRLRQLEARVKTVAPPTEEQLQRYYRANPDKFTEPQRQRVSVILLRVAPSAPRELWDAAMEEGERLVDGLKRGADFAELARLHSGDAASAQKGGDMGYLHAGMLATPAENAIAELQVAENTPPIRVLEGVAIFRLTERSPARLRAFVDVRDRCLALWMKQETEDIWRRFKTELRKTIPVEIVDPAFKQQSSLGAVPPGQRDAGAHKSSVN